MSNEDILKILKTDLQISATQYDNFLEKLILRAKDAISTEGIVLGDSVEDGMLVEAYAAYLYRKRKEENVAMPRSIRYELNNRLISQKAKVE